MKKWYEDSLVTTYLGESLGLAPGWVRKNFKLPNSKSAQEFDIYYEHDTVDQEIAGTLEAALYELNKKEKPDEPTTN